MTRNDIARDVAKATGLDKETSDEAVLATLDAIRRHVLAGEKVSLSGFGTFARKLRAPKVARNLSDGTLMKLPARYIPSIKFSNSFVAKMPEP